MLPLSLRMSMLRRTVEHHCKAPKLEFPFSFANDARFLVIMPNDPLSAFHQIPACMALASHFATAQITIVCRREIAPFFKAVKGVTTILEFDLQSKYVHSEAFDRMGRDVAGAGFSLCVVMEPIPDLPLLLLAGQSAAKVRVGFAGGAGYPFVNLQIRPSADRLHVADRGLFLVSMLGAPTLPMPTWTVAKESAAEVKMLLHENGVAQNARLIGIDGGFFLRNFGSSWTAKLIGLLRKTQYTCYLFSYEEPEEKETEWLLKQSCPVLSGLPVAQCAALVSVSVFVAAGPTVLYEFAALLSRPVAGIFTEDEHAAFCRETKTARGFTYASRPGQKTIEAIGQFAAAVISGPAKSA